MKNPVVHSKAILLHLLIVLSTVCFVQCCVAQTNSWISPASGNWEDSSWSLGMLPGTNQTIFVTNSGWKAVQITENAAANFPDSLSVNSIFISSPTNSFNTLLMNYAGFSTPLTVQTLTVSSNSAMAMNSSALQINGPSGQGMEIGGRFDQNDSIVAGNQVNVGYAGPGIYNLNSGTLAVSHLWLGGSYGDVFNQNAGTNNSGITHLEAGDYALSNGVFNSTIYFDGGNFEQYGGLLNTNLMIYSGSYLLAGGVLQGGAEVPYDNGWTTGSGSMVQTGGTNYGQLDIGSEGYGSYVMSNGVSVAPYLSVDWGGTYDQWDGVQTVTGALEVTEEQINQYQFSWGVMNVHGGQVSSASMIAGGTYNQSGGTNSVAGELEFIGSHASIALSGGLLAVGDMKVNPSWVGGIHMTGGVLIVTNELWIGGTTMPQWQGFNAGGQLVVGNIWLAPQSIFYSGDGVITQSGTLVMENANLYASTNAVQFGAFCLAGDGTNNSTIYMPTGASVVQFAPSSGVVWSNGPALVVENWAGSLYGGGTQQIIFGNATASLTASQLAQVRFHNPAGLAAGMYSAKILSNGEIVPNSGAALPASMALSQQTAGMQVKLQAELGHSYCIEVSPDLVHWTAWTNVVNSNGCMRLTDPQTTNCPARFYRARLIQ